MLDMFGPNSLLICITGYLNASLSNSMFPSTLKLKSADDQLFSRQNSFINTLLFPLFCGLFKVLRSVGSHPRLWYLDHNS